MQVYTLHRTRILLLGMVFGIGLFIFGLIILIQHSKGPFLHESSSKEIAIFANLEGESQNVLKLGIESSVWKSILTYQRHLKAQFASHTNAIIKGSLKAVARVPDTKSFKNINVPNLGKFFKEPCNDTDEDYGEYGESDIVADKFENNDYEQYYDENGNPETFLFKDEHFDFVPTVSGKTGSKESSLTTPATFLTPSTSSKTKELRMNIKEKQLHSSYKGSSTNLPFNGPKTSFSSEAPHHCDFQKYPSKEIKKFVTPFKSNWKTGRQRKVTMVSQNGLPIVEDSIFWSRELERLTPKGLTDEVVARSIQDMQTLQVIKVEAPTWNRCGRPKNQYVTFEDGSHACARYRSPHDYLVQGEAMSFYLARLLGISNVPTVTLVRISMDCPQWNRVMDEIQEAGWQENATVALVKWIDHLERDRMPPLVLGALHGHGTISWWTKELPTLPLEQLIELLQWSDLIVFDYITGNYDRVASMQDAADKEKNPTILHDTVHNLAKSRSTKGLWLIDNESGLLDGYSLLYGKNSREDRFHAFHRNMLKTTCIFRWSTFRRIEFLHTQGRAEQVLLHFVSEYEPQLPDAPNDGRITDFQNHFQERVDEVYNHMKRCMSIHSQR